MPGPPPPEPPSPDPADLAGRLDRLARENAELFERLRANERRFRGLTRSVWRVQEAERRRLAGELHDGLGQELTALKIGLERLQAALGRDCSELAESLAGPLAAAVEAAARALGETRRLSHRLRPRVLDDLGLVPALAWLGRTVGEWTGVEVRVATEGLDGDGRLDPDAETLLFRVAQEALTNAVEHSGAAAAEIVLGRAGGRLVLTVRDAGRGFDPAELAGAEGTGLAGMRDRVELFGGELTVDAAPGRGVVVTARVPA